MTAVTTVLALLLAVALPTNGAVSHETELRKKLMTDYDKLSLPNVFSHISIGFTILGIEMDEEKEVVNLDTWVKLEWNDPRLTWDASLYPNIDRLAIRPDDLWIPDITVYNNARMNIWNPITKTLVLVFPDGKILTVPTAIIPAMCVYDMTYWPHDVQNCTAKLGSWVFSGKNLNLTKFHGKDPLSFDIGQIKGDKSNVGPLSRGHVIVKESKVTFQTNYYACCPEPYMDVQISLILERNAPAYNWLVKIPAVVLSLMTCVLFLLPPGSTEKITVGSILLLTNMLYLFSVTKMVQHSPSHTPLIVRFISEQLIITLVTVIVSCFVVRCCNSPHRDSLPRWINKLVFALHTPFCLRGYYANASSSHSAGYLHKVGVVDKESGEDQSIVDTQNVAGMQNNTSEWLLFGAVMDRIIMIFYIVIFLIRLAAYSAIF